MLKRSLFLITLFGYQFGIAQDIEGLVARYSFNHGNANDDLGHFHGKAYEVALTQDRFKNANSAYYFFGTENSYINLGTSNVLKPKTGTISLWAKSDCLFWKGKGIKSNPLIFTHSYVKEFFNEAYVIAIDLETQKAMAATNNGGGEAITQLSKEKISLGEWHHFVLTYDYDSSALYLDGELQHKIAKKYETQFLEGDSIIVGNRVNEFNTRFFLGAIDDIEIYNRALNTEEVQQLYNSPNPNANTVLLKQIALILIFFFVIATIVWIIRLRLNSIIQKEKEKNELKNSMYEQDIKVLKAQMNPHFIFNSLNSIQQFIITNENDKAQQYLSTFSKLIRRTLDSNINEHITLDEEIEILEHYIEIESLRFDNVFNYEIIRIGKLNGGALKIPHFLIQPIVENAIWHGLLPKDGEKKLRITFEQLSANTLLCVVDDNGVGRESKKSTVVLETKRSLAIHFIVQRLELISKLTNHSYTLTIVDKINAEGTKTGTKVEITLPLLNS